LAEENVEKLLKFLVGEGGGEMNGDDIISCLRKSSDSPEMVELLNSLKVKKSLKLQRGEDDVRVNLPKQGLSLIFTREAPKTSKMFFSTVQFFSDAQDGFNSFNGDLPRNLVFSDSQIVVRNKLGKPPYPSKELKFDNWENEEFDLTVQYTPDFSRIKMVGFSVPMEE
jgi:hypothetical protein